MAQNTSPIFGLVPHVEWTAAITAANTAYDGTGTVTTAFTADATDGSFVNKIRLQALGGNVASLARVFINNGSTNTTASNNSLILEIGLPATSSSNTIPIPPFEYPLNIAIPAGYKLNVTLATAVAGGYIATVYGADY